MSKKLHLNRRDFIEKSAVLAAGISLSMNSSCSESSANKTVNGACCLDCPDSCSWTITVKNDKIIDFSASKSNPYTAGKLCDKMANYPQDVTYNPERILKPLKRVGEKGKGQFEEISWDKAISEISTKLKDIIAKEGGEAILPFSYGGNEGNVQINAGNQFFAHIGATKLDRTICGDAAVAGILATNGQTTGVLPEDIIHSRFIILWGTNTVNSNQHLWPFIEKARANGAKIIVIDPFKSQTAILADKHIQPLPGTDTVLALGMMHVILKENLEDKDYIEKYTEGISELTQHVISYTPRYVAKLCGLEEVEIVELAKAYAAGNPSLIRVLIGLEHHANGANAYRAIAMLPALIGAWKQKGGGLMNMTYELFGDALNYELVELPEALSKVKTRSVNMVHLGKALTDNSLKIPFKALIVFNSNPAVTMPNQNLVIKGLERTDLLTIVLEHFITDTCRYADYVFPASTSLENWDLLSSYGTPYLNINEPAIEPLGESKPNTEFFRLLSKEMGYTEKYLFHSDLEIVKSMLDSNKEKLKGITFGSLRKTGWAKINVGDNWMPHAKGNFGKPGGKCMFYNSHINPPLPEYKPVVHSEMELSKFPLKLLTIKSTKNFLNSSRANHINNRQKEGKPFLEIHEKDAENRNIQDGDSIKAFNERGEVLITARIQNKVKQGVVCMPQGYWSSLIPGGSSANALTSDLLTDMGGSAALQECQVEIVKI